ncbi:patatin-like phospholipase family protein [Chryseobacterium sp. MEBOG06]|uniref:patatin-like phospholipase family protein n=1 Tax=Chryseobacterium sp. MEBOG06 TaxID=2879938 RepID=UPI001F3B5A0C|nr:patatin-like phospholipase family protein [Chryseobacterium sp. MEBOG06]UKB82334.1 patatin-like phospholipase family protein [Chryseobacterium sp. MEBOG06]
MKALVISGGGSKGAFAGGVAEHLIENHKNDYKLFVGTSTGSLLIPFLALGDIQRIKKLYTTIEQSDIFTVCPFKITNKNGKVKIGINHLGIIKQFIKKQKTLGDSTNLRNLIRHSFTEHDFEKIKELKKEIVVTVANLTTQQIEYKSSNDHSYEDFCDWIWASSNMVPLMSLCQKNGNEYADGGFGNLIPLQHALEKGASSIDTIVLRLEKTSYNNPPLQNVLDVFARTTDFMLNQIASDDLIISQLEAATTNVHINFFFINRILTTHSFIFDKEEMTKWWQEGLELFQTTECKSLVLKAKPVDLI